MNIIDCVIIGSGPAGYTSAIYLARSNIKHYLYTGDLPGGQLVKTTIVENYPGFSKGILGIKLMSEMYKQAIKFGTKIKYNKILKVSLNNNKLHILYTKDNKKIITKSVIIATGSLPKYLNIKDEKKFLGYGISYCAICDGMFYKNKIVAVIGGGDTALEDSILLSKICKKIYLIVRKNKLKASKYLQNILYKIKNINILFNKKINNFLGDKYLKSINLLNNKNKIITIKVSGVFIAIGSKPNSLIFKNQIKMDKKGYIITKNKSTKTNIPGIFAAGEVQDKKYRQAITSAGSGCMAALEVEKYLNKLQKKK
ncbi:thioredoxin-disulfide reductase [Candidatus Shikimatogenerans bostrichidophilus]|uniref:thioredoxin-disulfide reductase n=1 Tax=Candidatus Shikimatogenerans bostrichidophilus TaxID=2943807 RepID=UPI0029676F62